MRPEPVRDGVGSLARLGAVVILWAAQRVSDALDRARVDPAATFDRLLGFSRRHRVYVMNDAWSGRRADSPDPDDVELLAIDASCDEVAHWPSVQLLDAGPFMLAVDIDVDHDELGAVVVLRKDREVTGVGRDDLADTWMRQQRVAGGLIA